mgnify:CR=1
MLAANTGEARGRSSAVAVPATLQSVTSVEALASDRLPPRAVLGSMQH